MLTKGPARTAVQAYICHRPWINVCISGVNRALISCASALFLSIRDDFPQLAINQTSLKIQQQILSVSEHKSVQTSHLASLNRLPQPQSGVLHILTATCETSPVLSRDPWHFYLQRNKTFPEAAEGIPKRVNWKASQIPLLHYQSLPTVTD